MEKIRLDVLMVEKGLAESRNLAQRLVMAGQVRVDGQVVLKPATKMGETVVISVDRGPKFVSRGGEKLDAALQAFGLTDLQNRVCADVGASTGGFTDCLLQHGAANVYAIDVGYGELHWKLRNDPRVVVMEKTNARFVTNLPEPVDLVSVDASFISLRTLLPVIKVWLSPMGEVVALIKPQFEAGRAEAAKGEGVIRDPAVHGEVLKTVLEFAQAQGYGLLGLIRSPLTGPKGNVEFLAHWNLKDANGVDADEQIQKALMVY
ncbi:MAG TPA: TlyA family RNA methyltransferase [Longilinea sp.]|nr:TlyA family RNA methyltransferase [Longilinea sp.]